MVGHLGEAGHLPITDGQVVGKDGVTRVLFDHHVSQKVYGAILFHLLDPEVDKISGR